MHILLKSYIQNEVYNVRIFFKMFTKGNNSYIQERVLKIIYDAFTGRVNLAYIP